MFTFYVQRSNIISCEFVSHQNRFNWTICLHYNLFCLYNAYLLSLCLICWLSKPFRLKSILLYQIKEKTKNKTMALYVVGSMLLSWLSGLDPFVTLKWSFSEKSVQRYFKGLPLGYDVIFLSWWEWSLQRWPRPHLRHGGLLSGLKCMIKYTVVYTVTRFQLTGTPMGDFGLVLDSPRHHHHH